MTFDSSPRPEAEPGTHERNLLPEKSDKRVPMVEETSTEALEHKDISTHYIALLKDIGEKNPEFKKEWEDIQPEMDVIRAMIDARIAQNLTQKELALRTGINQADISKLENGTRNPSVNLLKRLAEGMGMALKIEFIPKQKI